MLSKDFSFENSFLIHFFSYIFMNLRRSLKLGQEGFLIANLKAVIKFLGELDGTSLKDGKLEIKDPSKLYA